MVTGGGEETTAPVSNYQYDIDRQLGGSQRKNSPSVYLIEHLRQTGIKCRQAASFCLHPASTHLGVWARVNGRSPGPKSGDVHARAAGYSEMPKSYLALFWKVPSWARTFFRVPNSIVERSDRSTTLVMSLPRLNACACVLSCNAIM
jgi:hypothetical protein